MTYRWHEPPAWPARLARLPHPGAPRGPPTASPTRLGPAACPGLCLPPEPGLVSTRASSNAIPASARRLRSPRPAPRPLPAAGQPGGRTDGRGTGGGRAGRAAADSPRAGSAPARAAPSWRRLGLRASPAAAARTTTPRTPRAAGDGHWLGGAHRIVPERHAPRAPWRGRRGRNAQDFADQSEAARNRSFAPTVPQSYPGGIRSPRQRGTPRRSDVRMVRGDWPPASTAQQPSPGVPEFSVCLHPTCTLEGFPIESQAPILGPHSEGSVEVLFNWPDRKEHGAPLWGLGTQHPNTSLKA
ncbi:translation initiation factor IF-2-like [Prionailurus bengalensis]|uniref:translation initiation factor IF-2-like n=1 Tax=Prionailurus bengalensis TaxID=37029 RepID=UPI001CAA0BD7|nr:translation initiation factor IF-2-like [Prionailurus bengalensis]